MLLARSVAKHTQDQPQKALDAAFSQAFPARAAVRWQLSEEQLRNGVCPEELHAQDAKGSSRPAVMCITLELQAAMSACRILADVPVP